MRNFCTLALLSIVLGPALAVERASAQTAVNVSAHIGSFHLAVANYYHVPEREVVVIKKQRIPDEEIPVALFIAQRAVVSSATVVNFRLRGESWWDISVRFGLTPDVYYVPVAGNPGPPYGRAYGHYKKKSRDQWKTIVLTDADIVNLVHLRFLSEHYRVAPERIIEMRRERDFVAIHASVKGRDKGGYRSETDHGRDKGKGKQAHR
ncbi:MAG TPA: hypothetical protein VI485_00250 [Vicinamibacterales bacterium]|nr:hypothetical protein [Vicinamibacterales bacterium]